jgi:hypothetical protein
MYYFKIIGFEDLLGVFIIPDTVDELNWSCVPILGEERNTILPSFYCE